MEKRTKPRSQKYSNTLKRKIGMEYLAGQYSYAVCAELYDLPNKDAAKEIVRWYRKNYELVGMSEPPLDSSSENSQLSGNEIPSNEVKSDSQDPVADLATLQAELAAARLKISGLESLIDLAESELNISIRKKSGTKPSKRCGKSIQK